MLYKRVATLIVDKGTVNARTSLPTREYAVNRGSLNLQKDAIKEP
jgi:hypothetical protein